MAKKSKRSRRNGRARVDGDLRVVSFLGEHFPIPDRIGALPMMRLAKAAASGLDTADMEGMAAMYDFLRQVIRAEDWARFEDHAVREHATEEELLDFVQRAMAAASGRPPPRPSGSSDGSPSTSRRSAGDSSSLDAQRQLEQEGRPDLALMVLEARESRASA